MRAFCLAVALTITLLPGPGALAQQEHSKKPPKYKVAFRYPQFQRNPLWLNISIKKKHANRDDLLALAKRLGTDLSNFESVMVFILDEHRQAKSYHPGRINDDVCEDDCRRALGAAYSFDRSKGEHYLELYEPYEAGKKRESVRIDLGAVPAAN
ncbi:MAG: hypothetical protein ACRD4T_05090 [Candidatus Acidiferrales bacterium]